MVADGESLQWDCDRADFTGAHSALLQGDVSHASLETFRSVFCHVFADYVENDRVAAPPTGYRISGKACLVNQTQRYTRCTLFSVRSGRR